MDDAATSRGRSPVTGRVRQVVRGEERPDGDRGRGRYLIPGLAGGYFPVQRVEERHIGYVVSRREATDAKVTEPVVTDGVSPISIR